MWFKLQLSMNYILIFFFLCVYLCEYDIKQQIDNPVSYNFIVDHTNFIHLPISSTSFKDNLISVSLRIVLDTQQAYLLRLDFFPFLAIHSKNDNPIMLSSQVFSCILKIKRLEGAMNKREALIYNFILQVRQAFILRVPFTGKEVTIYRYILKEYLPIILCILLLTFVAEKWIFGFNTQQLTTES